MMVCLKILMPRATRRVCPRTSNTPLQTGVSPNSVVKCLTLVDGKALVKTLATMSSVGQ